MEEGGLTAGLQTLATLSSLLQYQEFSLKPAVQGLKDFSFQIVCFQEYISRLPKFKSEVVRVIKVKTQQLEK